MSKIPQLRNKPVKHGCPPGSADLQSLLPLVSSGKRKRQRNCCNGSVQFTGVYVDAGVEFGYRAMKQNGACVMQVIPVSAA
jgi:hypothetical protein